MVYKLQKERPQSRVNYSLKNLFSFYDAIVLDKTFSMLITSGLVRSFANCSGPMLSCFSVSSASVVAFLLSAGASGSARHGVLHHELEGRPVIRIGAGEAIVYLNAVFDTNGKAFSGAQSAGKGLISWAFAVLPVYPTGLRKPCFSFQ